MAGVFDPAHELMCKARCGEASFQSVLNLVPDDDAITKPISEDLNHARYIVGERWYQLANYQRAQTAFERSLADWPGDWQCFAALANTCSELNEPEQSIAFFTKNC
ncbi:MAG: hypothetical protein GY927_14655 [bacterium]|nr:hypothetical protein [bacterium]